MIKKGMFSDVHSMWMEEEKAGVWSKVLAAPLTHINSETMTVKCTELYVTQTRCRGDSDNVHWAATFHM